MTLEEAGKKALKIANRYSAGGAVLTGRRVADYNSKLNTLANDAQQDLATVAKIPAEFKLVVNPFTPVAGSSHDTYNFEGDTTAVLLSASNIHAVSFKITTDTFDIRIEEETSEDVWEPIMALTTWGVWAPESEIHVEPSSDTGGFREYKYGIAPTVSTNAVRIKCQGDYPFSIKDYALWTIKPQSGAYNWHWDDAPETFDNSSIPPYSEVIEYDLPSDFYKLNESMQIGEENRWLLNQVQFDAVNNKVYVGSDLTGEIRVFYYKYPTEIDEDTASTYEFELVNQLALTAIPFYIAGVMIAEDIGDMANFCMQRYEALKAQILATNPVQNNIKQVQNSIWRRRGEWHGRL